MRLRVVIGGGICVLLPDWITLSLVFASQLPLAGAHER